jgi:hypothetical protein
VRVSLALRPIRFQKVVAHVESWSQRYPSYVRTPATHRPVVVPGERAAGKLKDLGNSLLGNFGMSLDNFKAVKDPTSGSYSISFQQ